MAFPVAAVPVSLFEPVRPPAPAPEPDARAGERIGANGSNGANRTDVQGMGDAGGHVSAEPADGPADAPAETAARTSNSEASPAPIRQ